MQEFIIAVLVLVPFLLGGVCFFATNPKFRNTLIYLNSILLVCASCFFLFELKNITIDLSDKQPFDINLIIQFCDLTILAVIGYFGTKHKHWAIVFLAILQVLLLLFFEIFMLQEASSAPFIFIDTLSIIMILIVSVVGSLICLFAIPYMKKHEEHLNITKTKQNVFFAIILMFLGAMNGLVVSNNLLHLYFFFEFTTLCSFLLIGHDHTFAATRNALKALWMNSLGGLSLLIALVLFYGYLNTLDIHKIIEQSFHNSAFLLPLTMLILAAFIKSAQPPFQGWLLGAMVAPTPTSALLHSSTMVKVGVYLAIRFSPAYIDSILATCVALFGAFVFVSSALSAIGQSNGKKVLAYSTVSNLGLIFACAGIGTATAITAGILLIIFHAVSKALLFLCVGTIEQKIGSRDIEDMRGIYKLMPITALVMLIGIISIILPPFGMLVGKWMAIEAASSSNIVIILILALGSSATVLYWARWLGVLLSFNNKGKIKAEKQPILTRYPLLILCLMVVVLSVFIPHIYEVLITPVVNISGISPFTSSYEGIFGYQGGFIVAPLFLFFVFATLIAVLAMRKSASNRHIPEYLCGANVKEDDCFRGPMNEEYKSVISNYYFMSFCSEETGAKVFNVISLGFIAFMIGVAIQFSTFGGAW